ncbi:hypothetical protein B0T10DRAFT_455656 [Thelonectria olida]|uniref:Putative transcription factor kapC n=1 Tax=Thelonectria olida TaxID=1576542 RepID=A0A9P8WA71_9HYPO|nr:hypothetical protein B0T10DRAFT_455656 [Thelonectria olida]
MQTSSANGAGSSQAEHDLRAQLELLKNHDAASSSSTTLPGRDFKNAPPQPSSARPSNGYESLTAVTPDIRALSSKPRTDTHIHPELRARTTMMPIVPPSGHSPGASAGPSASIAPATHAPPPPHAPGQVDLQSADGRKAKRELSQSKRAAQNRAAQRAFRQRKEGYIKKLEQQVREYVDMETSFKNMQSENYALREYVIHLQSKLLDLHGEFPSPPPNVDLSRPPPPPVSVPATASAPTTAPSAPAPAAAGTAPSNVAAGPLEAVAQAVAGLAAQEQIVEQQQQQHQSPPPHQPPQPGQRYPSPQPIDEEMRSAEEIDAQLQQPDEPPA